MTNYTKKRFSGIERGDELSKLTNYTMAN